MVTPINPKDFTIDTMHIENVPRLVIRNNENNLDLKDLLRDENIVPARVGFPNSETAIGITGRINDALRAMQEAGFIGEDTRIALLEQQSERQLTINRWRDTADRFRPREP